MRCSQAFEHSFERTYGKLKQVERTLTAESSKPLIDCIRNDTDEVFQRNKYHTNKFDSTGEFLLCLCLCGCICLFVCLFVFMLTLSFLSFSQHGLTTTAFRGARGWVRRSRRKSTRARAAACSSRAASRAVESAKTSSTRRVCSPRSEVSRDAPRRRTPRWCARWEEST